MIKANVSPNRNELGAISEPSSAPSFDSSALAVPFVQLFDQLRSLGKGSNELAMENMAQDREGLTIIFQSGDKPNSSLPRSSFSLKSSSSQGGFGSEIDRRKHNTIHGRESNTRISPPSDYDKVQNDKARSAKSVPGLANSEGREAMQDKRPDSVNRADLSRAFQAADSIGIDAKATDRRADGSPILRDDQGTAKVLKPDNPDNSLKNHLAEEGDGAQMKKISRSLQDAASQRESASAAYASKMEKMKSEAPGRHADKVRDGLKSQAVSSGDTNQASKAGQEEKAGGEEHSDSGGASGRGDNASGKNLKNGDGSAFAKAANLAAKSAQSSTKAGSGVSTAKAGTANATANSGGTNAQSLAGSAATVDASSVAKSLAGGRFSAASNKMAQIMAAKIQMMDVNGRPELRLQVAPRELGSIHIRLIGVGEQTEVRMFAERESVGRLLEAAAPQMLGQLAKAGVDVGPYSVDYAGADSQNADRQGQAAGDGQQTNDGKNGKEADDSRSNGDDTGRRSRSSHDGEIDVVA